MLLRDETAVLYLGLWQETPFAEPEDLSVAVGDDSDSEIACFDR